MKRTYSKKKTVNIEKKNNRHSKGYMIFYAIIKRIFDIVCSIVGMIFLIPLIILVKVTYLLSKDKENIFFIQDRIGKNGKTFRFYKFRTMIPNADEELKKLLAEDPKLREEYKINKKLHNDPRITKMGKILRRTSLDELPQVLNILKGDMAVIGNRPYLPREKSDMGDYYNVIVSTKPGLTGYWQVHGRNDVTFRKRLELESYYSENCGLWLDIQIFFKTFTAVLGAKGVK